MALGFSILDIGSSKAVCLICNGAARGGFAVSGYGVSRYSGFRFSKFLDESDLRRAVREAVDKAEAAAKRTIVGIFVAVPASFSRVILRKGSLSFTTPRRLVRNDVDRLIDSSAPDNPPEGFELIHSSPITYTADGAEYEDLPVGREVNEIVSVVSHAYVDGYFKRAVSKILDELDIHADLYIDTDLALSSYLMDEESARRGALLVDVGYFTTDICYIQNCGIAMRSTLEVGGMHIANDLSYGLELPLSVTEGIKRRFVFSLNYENSVQTIKVKDAGVVLVEDEAVAMIVESRTSELLDIIRDTVLSFNLELKAPLFLTGGGLALMRGAASYIESHLNVVVCTDMPKAPVLNSQNYASALAMANFLVLRDNLSVVMTGDRHASLGNKIKDFFSK